MDYVTFREKQTPSNKPFTLQQLHLRLTSTELSKRRTNQLGQIYNLMHWNNFIVIRNCFSTGYYLQPFSRNTMTLSSSFGIPGNLESGERSAPVQLYSVLTRRGTLLVCAWCLHRDLCPLWTEPEITQHQNIFKAFQESPMWENKIHSTVIRRFRVVKHDKTLQLYYYFSGHRCCFFYPVTAHYSSKFFRYSLRHATCSHPGVLCPSLTYSHNNGLLICKTNTSSALWA